jgi:hypothetical protein
MASLNNVLMRIVAVFAASGLGVIGAGAVAGIPVMKAVMVAGLTAVAAVIEKLARAFMDDGKLTLDEINAAFSSVDTKAKTVADLQVEARQTGQNVVVSANSAMVVASAAEAVAPAPEDDPNYN